MNTPLSPKKTSWLSLVAETAGVTGARVTRVELGAHDVEGPVRVVLQVCDLWGQVVGATYWYGEGEDLRAGVLVDLGCDVLSTIGAQLCAWVDELLAPVPASEARVPRHATLVDFDEFVMPKMMLRAPLPIPKRAYVSAARRRRAADAA